METMYKERLLKTGVILAWVLIVFVAAKAVGEVRGYQFIGRVPGSNVISVTGTGEALVKPDLAELSFSIVAEGAQIAAVQEKATTIEKKALQVLRDNGIAEKDIKTTNYYLAPRYEYRTAVCSPGYCPPGGERTLVGYEVRQSMTVQVRKTESVGAVLAALGGSGVSDIGAVQFTVDDDKDVMAEARREAIADARAKAKVLADDLNVSLGRIVSFNESGTGAPTPLMYEKLGRGGADAAVAAAPELPSGENRYQSTVSISYEIN